MSNGIKGKGSAFVNSVKENETVRNSINKVSNEYGSLLKKQRGHIVEWLTIFAGTFLLSFIIKPLGGLFFLEICFTIYLLKAKNTLVKLSSAIDASASKIKMLQSRYIKSLKETHVMHKKSVEADEAAYGANAALWRNGNMYSAGQTGSNRNGAFDAATVQYTMVSKEALVGAEREYTSAVTEYNTYLHAIPSNIAAYVWGYTDVKLIGYNVQKDVAELDMEADIDLSDF